LTGLANAVVVQWLSKSGYETIATPLTYGAVNFLKRKEGLDVFDYDTQFNPLLIGE
jgi:uncharacterized PurR-regulated membrane protein YhhQ (DUF165 family)